MQRERLGAPAREAERLGLRRREREGPDDARPLGEAQLARCDDAVGHHATEPRAGVVQAAPANQARASASTGVRAAPRERGVASRCAPACASGTRPATGASMTGT